MHIQIPHRRRTATTKFLLLTLCLIIVLDSLLFSPTNFYLSSIHSFVKSNGYNYNTLLDDTSLSQEERAVLLGSGIENLIEQLEEKERSINLRNRLEFMEEGFGGEDYNLNYRRAWEKYKYEAKMRWRLRLVPSEEVDDTSELDNNNDESKPTSTSYHNLIDSESPLSHYNLNGVMYSTMIYNGALGILVYDPPNDKFVLSLSKRHPWNTENDELKSEIYR